MNLANSAARTLLLSCSGHDPTGGAGLQADIEVAAALGVRVLSLPTVLTVQDTNNVRDVEALPVAWLTKAATALLEDARPQAVKVGLLGSLEQVHWLSDLLERLRLPVVLDPVLRAGGGAALTTAAMADAMKKRLFRHVTVLTPNAAEARALSGCDALAEAAAVLLAAGSQHVLITGGDEPGVPAEADAGGEQTVNWHSTADAPAVRHAWPRLPARFHGAGCTLAAAIGALLARGLSVSDALQQAQAYTHEALRRAENVGRGRLLPRRSW